MLKPELLDIINVVAYHHYNYTASINSSRITANGKTITNSYRYKTFKMSYNI